MSKRTDRVITLADQIIDNDLRLNKLEKQLKEAKLTIKTQQEHIVILEKAVIMLGISLRRCLTLVSPSL